MYEEVERLVGAVGREVETPDQSGGAARILRARRRYDVPHEDVWAALTEAERLSCWLAPVSGELRAGGRYRLQGAASGMIERCERGRRLSATWNSAGETGRIAVELTAADGGATLALEHVAHADPDRWRAFGPGVVGVGWDLALLGLGRHLGAPAGADFVSNTQEWAFTDEGRTFVRQSASAWGEAAAVNGEDRLRALEAAARAADAYAGEGSDAG
jgi:uncharacterized protein YndB with AHSA1/START domain